MNLAKLGLVSGAVVGVTTFLMVFLLPIAVIGGFLGVKLQNVLTGSSQGVISIVTLGLTVVIMGLLISGAMSLLGWLFGNTVKVILTKKLQLSSNQWCPVGKLTVDVRKSVMPKAVNMSLQWCPKV